MKCATMRSSPATLSFKSNVAAADAAVSAQGTIVVHVVDATETPQSDAAVSLFGYDRGWRYRRNLDCDVRTDDTLTVKYDGVKVAK